MSKDLEGKILEQDKKIILLFQQNYDSKNHCEQLEKEEKIHIKKLHEKTQALEMAMSELSDLTIVKLEEENSRLRAREAWLRQHIHKVYELNNFCLQRESPCKHITARLLKGWYAMLMKYLLL